MLGARFVSRSQWARARAPAPHEQWELCGSAHFQDRIIDRQKLEEAAGECYGIMLGQIEEWRGEAQ